MTTVHDRFDDIVTAFVGRPGVTPPIPGGPRRFGSDALSVDGSVFCMVSSGERFVVKLPAARVDELIAASTGEPFRAGKKSPMRQWLVVTDAAPGVWESLAEEAYAFTREGGAAPR
ncbi:hypothetical protein [Leifsonia shinshuensis]|uniref:hypothetical protein n=1 Tax=Leifsonia shinshuensis TaxID=150026 RepID=UPI002855B5DA|nr:hypothetical protein [Leifsonia shinshuensis]MDR6971244.1 hypothetical protein [Leifsonia shinshuensis]